MATTLTTQTDRAETTPDLNNGQTVAIQATFGEHSLGETIQNALIITHREMRDSFRDWRIIGPIFGLTLVFPLLAQGMTSVFSNFFVSNGAAPMVDVFLPLLPMIVGFFPISISLVIALETFVGEKERRSLEPLLSTPLTNTELYVGKTLAATIPPLAASYLGMGIYLIAMIFGSQQWRPEPLLIVQILMLTTAQALVMVTGAVVVSSQTTSTRASNLLASFIIIPMSMLVMLESFIMITNNRYVLWYLIAGLVVADVMLFGMGARIFNREDLLGRAIDQINLRWAWKLFRSEFRGGPQVKGIVSWYRFSVFPALKKLRVPALIVSISIVGVFLVGYQIAQARPDLQLPSMTADYQRVQTATKFAILFQFSSSNVQSVINAFTGYLRIIVGSTMLAVFSFGVIGIIFATVPFGVLGFLLGQPLISSLGLLGTFVGAVVPHSLVQIPAMIIGAAAATRLGGVITRPPEGKGIWDAWLSVLADVIKIDVGIVMPLLLIAAVIQVYITPRIMLAINGG